MSTHFSRHWRRLVKASKSLIFMTAVLSALVGASRVSFEAIGSLPSEVMRGAMPASSPYQSNLRIQSKLVSRDFVPDGKLQNKAWRNAAWAKFDRGAFGSQTFPQSQTEVATLWTPAYLYIAYRCKYSTLNIYEGEDPAKERWELWDRDVVEVFVNPQPERANHYYEFEVAPNNQWIDLVIDLDKNPFNDAGWNSGFEHATRVDPQKHVWTCEMRIPVHALDAPALEAGAEWRINFYRADGPGPDTQRRFLSWSPVQSSKRTFHTPSSFGLIRFVK